MPGGSDEHGEIVLTNLLVIDLYLLWAALAKRRCPTAASNIDRQRGAFELHQRSESGGGGRPLCHDSRSLHLSAQPWRRLTRSRRGGWRHEHRDRCFATALGFPDGVRRQSRLSWLGRRVSVDPWRFTASDYR